MLDRTAIELSESQKAVADTLNEDRNCFGLFSVNQLLTKRKIA
jgi:hypothetical protein